MYKTSKPKNRKIVGGLLLSAALTSFLTGITEPIEFTFLFVAPALYVLHCVLAGISFIICHAFDICIGTTFSCGFIDFTLYGLLQGNAKTNWFRIIPVFIGYAAAYYFIFKFFIIKFNLATPGREEDENEIKLYTREDYNKKNKIDGEVNTEVSKENYISAMILKGIGGEKNLVDIDACATRLRLTVVDSLVIDDQLLKDTGAKGIIKKGTGVQIIYGPHVSIIKSDFEEYVQTLSHEKA